ncbi:MAG: hypothetical protein ACXWZM_10060 [Solirubrobacterales bacterium]
MDREQAERERKRLAKEHPGSTWIVGEADDGWQVLRVGIPPVEGPSGTSLAAKPRPAAPDSPPSPDQQIVNPNWGF